MIDAVKILADVALENYPVPCVWLAADELNPAQQALRRRRRPFVRPASVAVLDEPFVAKRIDLPVDCPLHNPVPEAQRHDQPRFRVVNVKFPVISDLVSAFEQFLLDGKQVFFKVEAEYNDLVAIPFVLLGFAVCGEQILKRTDAVFQILQLSRVETASVRAARGVSARLRLSFSPSGNVRLSDKLRAILAVRPSGRFAAMPTAGELPSMPPSAFH